MILDKDDTGINLRVVLICKVNEKIRKRQVFGPDAVVYIEHGSEPNGQIMISRGRGAK